MDEERVISELNDQMGDLFHLEIAKTIRENIENNTPIGNLIIDLLCKAENGDFYEAKRPQMVRLCNTKYTNLHNNYDDCEIEQIIGCNFCKYYVPKYVLELFEKFEKEGFPTDKTLEELFG